MSKPDYSIQPKLTPAQTAAILSALEEYRRLFDYAPTTSSRWRRIFRGAHRQIRRAWLNAGWEPDADGQGWHRRA